MDEYPNIILHDNGVSAKDGDPILCVVCGTNEHPILRFGCESEEESGPLEVFNWGGSDVGHTSHLFICGDVCFRCLSGIDPGASWHVHPCDICGHHVKEEPLQDPICGRYVGSCCGAVYWWDRTVCICKECFDYKCGMCRTELDRQHIYWGDEDDEVGPLCDECHHAYAYTSE